MPLYEYECGQGHRFERFLPLERYTEEQSCDRCGSLGQRLISACLVAPDLPEYTSPVTGRPVCGRKQRREDLIRNNCVEYEPSMKTEYLKRREKEEEALDKSIENTVEETLSKWSARKKELLEQEVRAGASAEYVRATPAP